MKDFHIEIYKVLKESKFDTDSVFELLRDTANKDKSRQNAVFCKELKIDTPL